MRVAIIGAGKVGSTLGKGLARAGHEITYGSRDAAAAPPHEGARTASVRDAVAGSEVVVLATPWAAVGDAIAAAGDFGGRPLFDVTNPIGPGFALALGHTTSGAEHVASLAKNARVVKVFNTTGLENMADPVYGNNRTVMPVAADDREARDLGVRLAGELGFEAVPVGGLSRARDLEPFAMLWIKLAMALGHGRGIAFGLARRGEGGERTARRAEKARAITIVGTGNIGGALARAWLAAGHEVRLAVRDAGADDVKALVAAGAKAGAIEGAASGAEVVALAVPAGAASEIAGKLGDLGGKIVIDCTNAIGPGFTLKYGHTTSSAEELQKALGSARVVRSFNQQGAETLRDARFGALAAVNFVAGDDAAARAVVKGLSEDVGLDTIDVGQVSMSRLLEPVTVLWIAMAQALGTREIGLTLLRR
jgi:hypothetical protein